MTKLTDTHECRVNGVYDPTPWSVYLFESGTLYKIGITCKPRQRLHSLRNSSAVPVKHIVHAVVCCCDRAREIERGLHDYYAATRRHGEWFRLDIYQVSRIVAYLQSPWIDVRRRRKAGRRGEQIEARAKAAALAARAR
jgi:hypothetical protein